MGLGGPVRPRNAASLVLVRRTASGPEVLLGRRAAKHRFLPHVYAFPGGRLDSSDKSDTLLKPLENICHPGCGPEMMRALAVAALRETWEETGIALGIVAGGRLQPDASGLRYLCRAITPSDSPVRFHARFFLQDVSGQDLALGGSGELLDLGFRPLEAALRLPLADITEFVLRLVGRLGPDFRPQQYAFWRYRAGKSMIRWEKPGIG
ncbi:MAG TPA: NUDIX domain-containing protein [Ferrovibrio sp.]|uniref:NUDIX hydrolase n=1 Tax=Ferrovibrio sp. TaxID=1917215 RepID=UPI002ED1AD9D